MFLKIRPQLAQQKKSVNSINSSSSSFTVPKLQIVNLVDETFRIWTVQSTYNSKSNINKQYTRNCTSKMASWLVLCQIASVGEIFVPLNKQPNKKYLLNKKASLSQGFFRNNWMGETLFTKIWMVPFFLVVIILEKKPKQIYEIIN